jgi:DNA-binding helix-hairpin-helix protein with protein kinase domain
LCGIVHRLHRIIGWRADRQPRFFTEEAAMGQADKDYLLARAKQERALASETSDEIVRALHLKRAHEYSMLAHSSGVAAGADSEVLGLALRELRMF